MDPAIAEPTDLDQRHTFNVVGVLHGPPPMDQLGLVETVEALGEGGTTNRDRALDLDDLPPSALSARTREVHADQA